MTNRPATDTPIGLQTLEPRLLLSGTTGEQSVVYVIATYQDQNSGAPQTMFQARRTLRNAAQTVEDYSNDKLTYPDAEYLRVKLPRTRAQYIAAGTTEDGLNLMSDDIDRVLTNQGINPNNQNHIIVRAQTFWGLQGRAETNGNRIWMPNGKVDELVQQMGRNLGLGSSDFRRSLNGQSIGPANVFTEADLFSNMGRGELDWNAHQKRLLGWIGPNQVRTLSAPGTFDVVISPHDGDEFQRGKTYLTQFQLKSGKFLYLSARDFKQGLAVHLGGKRARGTAGGQLIDLAPNTAAANDAVRKTTKPLRIKQGAGTADDITVQLRRLQRDGTITVRVTLGPTAQPPSALNAITVRTPAAFELAEEENDSV